MSLRLERRARRRVEMRTSFGGTYALHDHDSGHVIYGGFPTRSDAEAWARQCSWNVVPPRVRYLQPRREVRLA